jgi:hypothetical protein
MTNKYIDGYFEDDYFEEFMAITPLPEPPNRGQLPTVFVQNSDAFLAAIPQLAVEIDRVATAMNANGTNSTSSDSHTIASSGSKTFTVQIGKSYVPGMTVRAAYTSNGTIWMQGDVTAYDAVTGQLSITMNASTGSGTYSTWTLSLSSSASTGGSLTQDFSVKSLTHAIGAAIASATTINLSTVTGNLAHVTGSNAISAATMTAGKDVWVIFDAALQLNYHATNLRLNSGGANVTIEANDIGLFTYDGTTVRVMIFKANGKAIVETAPPGGIPVGTLIAFARSSPPAGYLVCPTAATNISRVTYSDLYAAIGTTWGAGDGATTFGMPWFPANYTLLQASANVGTKSEGDVKSHNHSFPLGTTDSTGVAMAADGQGPTSSQVAATENTGGSANYAAGMRVLICVKYLWG